ncbi:CYTH domain-containing protein [Cellulophaga sp. HaHa_2_95]|uniref:CYTH domain-containing protein n=1 Tax=unclassified Cellulophaga TaxID=2634405 RepID=UPI001C4EEC4E|nr:MULTISPECIES: CYTH domain-containing protein [unclassified Cellulophaga]QXP50889.1 CYTH domain-containing protein [Cellulophaga sp. HaHa_2_1]QXP56782.1 CYTH domain-containing protein [Cellulophaga sp. HaHa_2_95]
MVEIERKFLVLSDAYKGEASAKIRIVQGFLNTDPERTVRVRIKGEQGFLTIKGKGNDTGVSRFEWEKEITISEAEALLKIVEPGGIEKFRYEVLVGNHTFEVDEFFGENEGLIVAEVELKSEDEAFKKPVWLGEEVSGIIKYYNSQLCKHPYKSW